MKSLNYIWPLERAYAIATNVSPDDVDDDYGTSFKDDVDAVKQLLLSRGLTTPYDLTVWSRTNILTGRNISHEYYPNAEVIRTNQDLDQYIADRIAARHW